MSSTWRGPFPSKKSMVTVMRGAGAGRDGEGHAPPSRCERHAVERPWQVGSRRVHPGRGAVEEAVAAILVPRPAHRDGAGHQRAGERRAGVRRAALPPPLVVVVEVAEDVQPDADVAAHDPGDAGALRVSQAAPERARHGRGGRAVDQGERNAVGAGAAVLPLVERGDDARTRRDRPVVEDRSGLVGDRVGDLQVAREHARRRDRDLPGWRCSPECWRRREGAARRSPGR